METETRIKMLFAATPEQLAAVDAVLTGATDQPKPETLRLLSMGECSKLTGLARCTIWRCVRDGQLKAVEIRAGSKRIPENELRRFVAGRK